MSQSTAQPINTLLPDDAALMDRLLAELQTKASEAQTTAVAILPTPAPPPQIQLVPKATRRRAVPPLPKPKALRVRNSLGDRLQIMARIDPRKLHQIEKDVDRWWRLLASVVLYWAC